MADRGFSETDLRLMLESAVGWLPDIVDGRWVILAKHHDSPWEVILEPDASRELLVVVTAYAVDDLK